MNDNGGVSCSGYPAPVVYAPSKQRIESSQWTAVIGEKAAAPCMSTQGMRLTTKKKNESAKCKTKIPLAGAQSEREGEGENKSDVPDSKGMGPPTPTPPPPRSARQRCARLPIRQPPRRRLFCAFRCASSSSRQHDDPPRSDDRPRLSSALGGACHGQEEEEALSVSVPGAIRRRDERPDRTGRPRLQV